MMSEKPSFNEIPKKQNENNAETAIEASAISIDEELDRVKADKISEEDIERWSHTPEYQAYKNSPTGLIQLSHIPEEFRMRFSHFLDKSAQQEIDKIAEKLEKDIEGIKSQALEYAAKVLIHQRVISNMRLRYEGEDLIEHLRQVDESRSSVHNS